MSIYGRLPVHRSPKADRHRKIEPTLRAFLPNPTLPTILNYSSFKVQGRLHGPKAELAASFTGSLETGRSAYKERRN